jgi:hypothetical protein
MSGKESREETMKFVKNWFSNFLPMDTPIQDRGVKFHTVEHFFQAMKCERDDLAGRREIAEAATPGQAKRLGRKVILRTGWDGMKLEVMEFALRHKFAPGTSWHKKLMETTEEITEWNNWHDNFWGHCKCDRCADKPHQNHLGRLLTKLRDEWKGK